MRQATLLVALLSVLSMGCGTRVEVPRRPAPESSIDAIRNVVVIFAENRAFDTLYGTFPGADGLANAPRQHVQRDRDGSVLAELPRVWNGLTARGVTPPVTQEQTAGLPNAPFAIDDPDGFNQSPAVITRDLWHRFYQNQMQINGGRNDMFAAWSDAGGLVMGYYNGAPTRMWDVARRYVLADNFFMGAFGGSFLNHQWLICACVPYYPNADRSPAAQSLAAVAPDGVTLLVSPESPRSALDGRPRFVNDGNYTPDFYAVNTVEPPYQPSGNAPAPGGDPLFADPSRASTLTPQTAQTIGDLLSAANLSWAWYGGAWQAALDGNRVKPVPAFQTHHQPFNYYRSFAPGTALRAQHLLDGGMNGEAFIAAIDEGRLPAVAFYKPQGNLNQHPGNADVQSGDAHIASVIDHLERSPQWPNMLVVVTYDENGGFWDHVAPPAGDRWGPGTRIPAIIVSPFAKRGVVDHTLNDTTSILRFITRRFELPVLPGIAARDAAFRARGAMPPGDLTSALQLPGTP